MYLCMHIIIIIIIIIFWNYVGAWQEDKLVSTILHG